VRIYRLFSPYNKGYGMYLIALGVSLVSAILFFTPGPFNRHPQLVCIADLLSVDAPLLKQSLWGTGRLLPAEVRQTRAGLD
jgi:hypothetical protein